MIKGGTKKQEPGNPALGRPGYRFDWQVADFIPVFCTPLFSRFDRTGSRAGSRFFRLDRPGRSCFDNLGKNQAAAEIEHWVVQASTKNTEITRGRISHVHAVEDPSSSEVGQQSIFSEH